MEVNEVGQMVRWARKRAGMTQLELADAVKMPQPSIARIERGTVAPRAATLIAILQATGHRLTVEPIGRPVDLEALHERLRINIPRRAQESIGRRIRDPKANPIRILRRLRRFAVPFVLIGDLAEAVYGSPIKAGRTIDVCLPETDAARDRLMQTIKDLGATPIADGEFTSDAGRLRVHAKTAAQDDHEMLARNAVRLFVDAGVPVHVAAIEDLVRARLARGTDEDRSAVDLLRAIVGLLDPYRRA